MTMTRKVMPVASAAAAAAAGLFLLGPRAVSVAHADDSTDAPSVSSSGSGSRPTTPSHRATAHSTDSGASTLPGATPRPSGRPDAAASVRVPTIAPAATARTRSTAPRASAAVVPPTAVTSLRAPDLTTTAVAVHPPSASVTAASHTGRATTASPPVLGWYDHATSGPLPQDPIDHGETVYRSAPPGAIAASAKINELFDRVNAFLLSLPANHVTEFLSGALLLVRRSLFNQDPTAKPVQLAQTSETVTGTLGAVDPEGDPIVYKLLSQPRNGTVTIDPKTGEYTYTPASVDGYGGTDQFTVALADTGRHLHLLQAAQTTNVSVNVAPSATLIEFRELDSETSKLAVRVDSSKRAADGIKVDAGTTFTLTLPGPTSSYTWLANKSLVDITPGADNTLTVKANQPGFLGLSVQAKDGTAGRYVGVYIADPTTHNVPDVSAVGGKIPVGTIALPNGIGDAFLEKFNFQDGVAPIDYLYIYDQGGADAADTNLTKLLTQAVRHGMVPSVVFYNIQAVAGTGVVEGPDPAYQAINEQNVKWGQTVFTGYMTRYFKKVAKDFTTMNQVGVPVQVVMEPDFLGYMATQKPTFQLEYADLSKFPATGDPASIYVALDKGQGYRWDDQAKAYTPTAAPVPDNADRTQNYANVMKPMLDAGLLTASDPRFDNTVEGMVKAINYYVGKNMPNVRIGWKTNIWGVSTADYQNTKMGLLHETDSVIYPWQNEWSGGVGWDEGIKKITTAGTNLGNFLTKVGATYWTGSPDRKPFIAIDKYGVDGAYPFDPNWKTSGTAAYGDMSDLITATQYYCNNGSKGCDDATINKYFGVNAATLKTLKVDASDPQFQQVFANFQNAAKADPNIAKWFFNADQWNNYLRLVSALSSAVKAPVMLWQIPQGHINGSTLVPGTDLPNTSAADCPSGSACGFEDSATSYFFGDSFTATGGRFDHLKADKANDPNVSDDSVSTITWGEHMTQAGQSGVMSVLFGAGLGISTRGAPTPGGDITDLNFWADKAAGYLKVQP